MTESKTKAKSKNNTSNGVRSARLYKAAARSRITNGSSILPNVDNRTFWVRRYRDINALILADKGGEANTSESVKMLSRRAACICVELERREMVFAQAGEASDAQLEAFQRSSNTLRRLLQALSPNLERKMRDTTPDLDSYLRQRARGREQAEQVDDTGVVDASMS